MLEKTLESPLDCKEIKTVNPKGNRSWIFIGKTDGELKLQYFGHLMWRTDSLEKTLRVGGEGDNRGWDGWMALPTWWIWVWTSSGSWWWTGKPGMLQSMELQRIGHNWVIELNWTELKQEYRSGLPFPSWGNLPDPGIEPACPALQADSLPLSHSYSNVIASRKDVLKNLRTQG